ncbi:unnamed protein product [Ectocarpus sp. 6 AP-2014]
MVCVQTPAVESRYTCGHVLRPLPHSTHRINAQDIHFSGKYMKKKPSRDKNRSKQQAKGVPRNNFMFNLKRGQHLIVPTNAPFSVNSSSATQSLIPRAIKTVVMFLQNRIPQVYTIHQTNRCEHTASAPSRA